MNKQKLLIATLSTLLLLNSCGTVADGLGGSKKKGSEEFLVKKNGPLVIQPSYGKQPETGAKKEKKLTPRKTDNSSIKEIINEGFSMDISEKNQDLDNSIEESIIKKIKTKKIKKVSLDENLKETTEGENETPIKEGFFQSLKKKFKNLEH